MLLFLSGCAAENGESSDYLKAYFLNKFPDKEIDLTRKLGDSVLLVDNADTILLKIYFNKADKKTTITEHPKEDTLFAGKVYKYKKLYYFCSQVQDSTYWISAVNIKKEYIQGLGTDFLQMYWISEELDNDNSSILHSLVQKDKKPYALIPDRKVLSIYFEEKMDSFPYLPRLSPSSQDQPIEEENNKIIDAKNFESEKTLIDKYYPNPVEDILNIETHYSLEYELTIFNETNTLVLSDNFNGTTKSLSLNHLPRGFYILNLNAVKCNKLESVKLFIQ